MDLLKRLSVPLIMVLIGCGDERNASSPESTVLKCVEALENFDVATVRSMMVPNAQNNAMLESMESAASTMSDVQKQAYKDQFGNRKHQVAITVEDDESAVVMAVSDADVPGMSFTFELVYEDSAWRVESIALR